MKEPNEPVFEEVSLPVYSALGQKSDLSFSLIRCCVLQLSFPLFLFLVVAVLVLFNAHDYTDKLGAGLVTFIWSVSVFALAACYIGILSLFIKLKPFFPRLFVILPIVGFVAMSVNTYLTVFHASLYLPVPITIAEVMERLPFNLAMGLIFETLFFTYVKPVLEGNAALKMRLPKDTKRMIRVSGEEFLVSDIVLLRSQDHYVEVVTDSEIFTIRARIKDMVEQLWEDEGVMPHRSYWVAWRKISSIEMSTEFAALTMVDGTVVPVAKGRKAEVEIGVNFHEINAAVA